MTRFGPLWDGLRRELDAWGEEKRYAHFWWRDDDAIEPSAALDRLLALTNDHGISLGLAVIPTKATARLNDRLQQARKIHVLQHGFSHTNHARLGEKKSEYPAERPVPEAQAEIELGWKQLTKLFTHLAKPVFVPPWNRISPTVIECLPQIGLQGLSVYGPSTRNACIANVMHMNTHIDPIDWRGQQGFIGEKAALSLTVTYLAASRLADEEKMNLIGLLTHHLVQDAATWAFLEAFAGFIAAHPAALWVDLEMIINQATHA